MSEDRQLDEFLRTVTSSFDAAVWDQLQGFYRYNVAQSIRRQIYQQMHVQICNIILSALYESRYHQHYANPV